MSGEARDSLVTSDKSVGGGNGAKVANSDGEDAGASSTARVRESAILRLPLGGAMWRMSSDSAAPARGASASRSRKASVMAQASSLGLDERPDFGFMDVHCLLDLVLV